MQNCPSCGSDNTQPVPMAYQAGVTVGSVTYRSSGYTGQSSLRSGRATARTETLLARSIAPPRARPLVLPFLLALVTFVGAYGALGDALGGYDSTRRRDLEGGIGLGVFALACGYWWLRWLIWNATTLRDQRKAWAAGIVCHRCGMVFSEDPGPGRII